MSCGYTPHMCYPSYYMPLTFVLRVQLKTMKEVEHNMKGSSVKED